MRNLKPYLKKLLRKYYKIEKYVDNSYIIVLTVFFLVFLSKFNSTNSQIIGFKIFGALLFLVVLGFILLKIKEISKSVSNQRLNILDSICTLNYHELLIGVEVGVLYGDYSQTILDRIEHNNCKLSKLILVDKWKNDETYIHSGPVDLLSKAKKKHMIDLNIIK